MTREYLQELGIEGAVAESILERMNERQTEMVRQYEEQIHLLRQQAEDALVLRDQAKAQRIGAMLDRAGMRSGVARETVLAAMMAMEQGEEEYLDKLREGEPALFGQCPEPYFAGPLQEEGEEHPKHLPFHYLRAVGRKGEA